jgi:hypothetical protein
MMTRAVFFCGGVTWSHAKNSCVNPSEKLVGQNNPGGMRGIGIGKLLNFFKKHGTPSHLLSIIQHVFGREK